MRKKSYSIFVTLVFFCGMLSACGVRNDPREVADKFCYLYLIELNQTEALTLASGLAKEKLIKEIDLLRGARIASDELQLAKPFIDYEMSRRADQDESHVMFNYLLTIEPKSGGKIEQEVLISTVLEDGRWRVNNFENYRGSAL